MREAAPEARVEVTEADDGRTARLVLAASAGNALDLVLVRELEQALDALGRWPHLTAVVIEGAGRDFSAGHPASQLAPPFAAALVESFGAAIRGLLHLDAPVIALVRGRCLGAGAALALAADVTVVDATTRLCLCDAPGAPNPAGTLLVSARLDRAHAAEVLLSGITYTGEEAAALQLVNEYAGGWEDAGAVVDRYIRKLGQQQPPAIVREVTRTVRGPLRTRLAEELPALEKAAIARLSRQAPDDTTLASKWRPV